MPIWRKLHVKTTDSLDFNDMPDDFTRLTWVLLSLKVCKEGRGLDVPGWIKSQLFPLRSDVTLKQVESSMSWYQERGMISRYKSDGRPYFQLTSWHEYQNTSRDAKSPYPGPELAEIQDKDLEVDKIDIDIDIEGVRLTNSEASQELVASDSGEDFQELETMAKLILTVIRPIYTEEEQADLKIIASSFCESGVTEAHVKGFPHWFEANGFYSPGTNPNKKKPSLINLTNDFLTYLGEVEDGVYAELEA